MFVFINKSLCIAMAVMKHNITLSRSFATIKFMPLVHSEQGMNLAVVESIFFDASRQGVWILQNWIEVHTLEAQAAELDVRYNAYWNSRDFWQ